MIQSGFGKTKIYHRLNGLGNQIMGSSTASVDAEIQPEYSFAIVTFKKLEKFPHVHVIISSLALFDVEGYFLKIVKFQSLVLQDFAG